MLTKGTFAKLPVRKIEFIGSGWRYGGIILYKKKPECLNKVFTALDEIKNSDMICLSQILNIPGISQKVLF